jgi:diketogulonate reductase-like aldo/keto reductase
VTSAEVALAWIVGHPGIGLTLIGARTIEQLHANLASLDVTLTPEQRATLDEVSAPTLDFPAAVVNMSAAVAFGGMTVDGTTYPAFAMKGKPRRGEY